MATGRPVAKTQIKYNSNSLKKNDEEEKEPIDIEFTDQKQILTMIAIEFKLLDVKEEIE